MACYAGLRVLSLFSMVSFYVPIGMLFYVIHGYVGFAYGNP